MLPNHSCFGAIAEEYFLEGTRLLASLEKINSSFLRNEFHNDCRRFLDDLVSTILSTVAARSPVGQGLSCFCPEIVFGGADSSAFHLFGQLLDGLFELGWVRGSEVEPAKAEFHSSVREQRQVETSSSRSHAPINSVFAFCNQPSFRFRRNLHRVSIIVLQGHFRYYHDLNHLLLYVFLLTASVLRGPSELHPVFFVSLDGVALDHETVKGAVACVLDFVRHHSFTKRSLFSETGISMLNTAVTAADAVRNSSRFDLWGAIDVEAGPVITYLKSCREKVLSQRKAVRDTRERWFSGETVASSAVGESAPRTTVRISDVVKVGDVQYVAEHEKFGLPRGSRLSPGKGKKRQASASPGVSKKQFSVSSRSASRPSFESALEKSFEKSGARRSVRDRRNASVFHEGYQ